MQIAILLFDGITALDAVGPYEVLSRLPGATTRFVAREPGPKRTHEGGLAMLADCSLAEAPQPEIVLVPGGFGVDAVIEQPEVLDWLRAAHEHSRWTTSVCTGSLILGAAGLLRGVKATTHWLWFDRLRELGAEVGLFTSGVSAAPKSLTFSLSTTDRAISSCTANTSSMSRS